MSAAARTNVFTVAPDAAFLPTFVEALFAGRIVPALRREAGPLALARATVFVPTQRARRALVAELAAASGGAALLPRVAALGALEDEDDGSDNLLDRFDAVPPAIDPLERRLLLTELVLGWTRALKGAIVGGDGEGLQTRDDRVLAVGASPADAFALAGELGSLIDEFTIEGVDPQGLRDLAGEDHDRYWQITRQFLQIAFAQWPQLLAERGRIDLAERRARLADAERARVEAGRSADPLIVLGAAGTSRAVARLMGAICRLPNGAVVLPGLDLAMSDDAFGRIAQPGEDAEEPAFGHPQAALKRTLSFLRIGRADVVELSPDSPNPRVRFLSEALRPAETTDHWPVFRAAEGDALARALDGVTLVEAADEREEALAIAIRLRGVLERPGQTAALVTPDRNLARRVAGELRRWDIGIDDSGGVPLGATEAGRLARLILHAADEATDAARLALLAHSATRLGRPRRTVEKLARLFELAVCRADHASDRPVCERIDAAREAAKGVHAHPGAKGVTDAQWDGMAALLGDLEAALAPLCAPARDECIAGWIAPHRETLDRIARTAEDEENESLTGEDAQALWALFDHGAWDGSRRLRLDLDNYRALFDRMAAEAVVRAPKHVHPRLKILGLLEARLLRADLMILAGLDETIWPPPARTDAFLNRPMRVVLGLTPPERRIGQTGHDFWMAMGAAEVLVTRARKRGGSPTTPSRLLQRIMALGDGQFNLARARGEELLRWARALDTPAKPARTPPPAPKPPVPLRPNALSVTRVERWIRDPYALYAERILRLIPLGPLDGEPGFAEQGTAIHEAIAQLAETFGTGPLPEGARERLIAAVDARLANLHENPAWTAFRRPRLIAGLDFFLDYHLERQGEVQALLTESHGRLAVPLPDGTEFTLSATADRIEVEGDGGIRIVDFKTGAPPSSREIAADLSPQLTLEAAMAARGAFPGLNSRAIRDALYVKLGGAAGGKRLHLQFEDETFADVAERHYEKLQALVIAYRDPDQAYLSRPMAKWANSYGEYDHLARVAEWSTGGEGASEA